MARREEIERLLDELAPHCSPRVLASLEREQFLPESFADEIAKPLVALSALLGSNYPAEIRGLLVDAIERWTLTETRAEAAALSALRRQLEADFLSADSRFWTRIAGERALETFDRARAQFVRDWAARTLPPELSPDDEQAGAIAAVHEHTLVTARAGSGKTRTLVTRAAFLIKHCRVAPSDLLLLAFNRAAAIEMQDRLGKLGCQVPHVMTFHALAYAIVHPAQALIYDFPENGRFEQSEVVTDVRSVLMEDARFANDVRQVMLQHFRADWERLTYGGLILTPDEGLALRRALSAETLGGEHVKSFGEKAIANFLFEHNVPYYYEQNRLWDGANYRPDFTIGKNRVVIEYFGLAGEPGYDEKSEKKREYWRRQPDWRLIELHRRDVGPDGSALSATLGKHLEEFGIDCQRLSEEEIWKRVRKRAILRFDEMTKGFIGRCRSGGVSPSALTNRIAGHEAGSPAEADFLKLASRLFSSYLHRLSANQKEDFDGLLERAAATVEGGTTAFDRKSGRGDLRRMRYVMIDEFQDFSPLFLRLLRAARIHNPSVQVFCVGDDWQAINAFAGADLRYVEKFEDHFTPSTRVSVTTNYRSSVRIVELGNQLMNGRGDPARPGKSEQGSCQILDLSRFEQNTRERELHDADVATSAIRRILFRALGEPGRVALLARRKILPSFIRPRDKAVLGRCLDEWVRGFSDEQKARVSISTAHGFKGLQAETVVILDAIERSFPLIHQNWVFTRVLGDSVQKLIDDERRLFYVACTRAARRVVFITDESRISPFVSGLESRCTHIDWREFPFISAGEGRWNVEVGNQPGCGANPTMNVRGLLKDDDFLFNRGLNQWERTVPISDAGIPALVESLQTRAWAVNGAGLQVRIRELDGKTLGVFDVDSGEWRSRP